MESLQAIKNRIQSIQSTRQITQSMRLVATSKVQKVRARMEANRPFLQESEQLIHMVLEGAEGNRLRNLGNPRALVIVIASDRGLCGGHNINVNKEAARLLAALEQPRLITIGAKAREYFRRRKKAPEQAYTGISETPYYADAAEIASLVFQWYLAGEIGRVFVVHTQFQSMLQHSVHTQQLLPLEEREQTAGPRALVRCEPDGAGILRSAAEFYLSAYLFGAILEASCCEQSARIASMDSAVKNADEMVETLTLRYNQARQSAITQEITEIVGGANAV